MFQRPAMRFRHRFRGLHVRQVIATCSSSAHRQFTKIKNLRAMAVISSCGFPIDLLSVRLFETCYSCIYIRPCSTIITRCSVIVVSQIQRSLKPTSRPLGALIAIASHMRSRPATDADAAMQLATFAGYPSLMLSFRMTCPPTSSEAQPT